ncbi:MAG TPA: leucyl aminopeptidase family protein [Thermopetrobacter sp.]|nr:leucyl aminopeptidase family protein [Thermopetrobacter sp.]
MENPAYDPATLLLPAEAAEPAIELWPVAEDSLQAVLAALPDRWRRHAEEAGFTAAFGQVLMLPGAAGGIERVLAGLGRDARALGTGGFARRLPAGTYRLARADDVDARLFALGWPASAYAFSRYKESAREPARLICPPGVARDDVLNEAAAMWLARDLINTPANDLGPAELEAAVRGVADRFGAQVRVVMGDALRDGFPLVEAVGRAAAADRAPRLIDLVWGDADAPKITIVGKGVCFDTGGLDLKPSSAMRLMKKDMGGAATALALARMIMAAGLPVRLRLLIPAVENAVAGGAMRPGDIVTARNGLSVEVGNTDAEGRLILADALSLAAEEEPRLILDFATLTGAARVALGPDLPALFCDDDDLAAALTEAGAAVDDPVWRLPLWQPYMEGLKGQASDLCNIASNGFAGAIVAALFLSRFVGDRRRWAHVDVFAWNPADKPARPKGGELQAARAVFAWLRVWSQQIRRASLAQKH